MCTVTLALPNKSKLFPVFHTSEIKPFHENDDNLFPTRVRHPPDPINVDGQQEFFINKIVDERRRGRRKQLLVRWRGEGPKGDLWLDEEELEECEALDIWRARMPEEDGRPEQEEEGRRSDQESRMEERENQQLTIKIPPRPRSISERGGV